MPFSDITPLLISALTNSIMGIVGGGYTGSCSNVIDYVTIASASNATDFGDLTVARNYLTGISNCHGGLS